MEYLLNKYDISAYCSTSPEMWDDYLRVDYVANCIEPVAKVRAERDGVKQEVPRAWQDFHSHVLSDTAFNIIKVGEAKGADGRRAAYDYVSAVLKSSAPEFWDAIPIFQNKIYAAGDGRKVTGKELLIEATKRRRGPPQQSQGLER